MAIVQSTAANRRKSLRRKPRNSVRLECRHGSHGFGPNVCATVLDLSDTGVRMITSAELDDKHEVEVIISSYGMKDKLKRVGAIRWQVKLEEGGFCVGIEFQKRLAYRDWQCLASPNG